MSLRKTLLFSSALFILPIAQAQAHNKWPAVCQIAKPCSTPASGYTTDPATGRLEIKNVCDLQGVQNNLSANYELYNDIDATCTKNWKGGFTPIPGTFSGSIEGNGYAINALSINSALTYVGLFQTVGNYGDNGSIFIRNIALTNLNVTSSANQGNGGAAGLAGINYGTISNIYVTGILSSGYAGGDGGLIGVNAGPISYSYTGVSLSAAGGSAGGLIGDNSASVFGSYASGPVTNVTVAGGLVGANINSGTIVASAATGAVVNTETNNLAFPVGGFVGENIGLEATIADSYSTGNVSGGPYGLAGGFAGWIGNSTTQTERAYSVGYVTGGAGSHLGGFVSSLGNSAIGSDYWDTTTTPGLSATAAGNNSGITGDSTAQLQAGVPSPFSTALWTNTAGVSFPYILQESPLALSQNLLVSSNFTTKLAAAFEPPLAEFAIPADLVQPVGSPSAGIVTAIPVGQNEFFQYDPADRTQASTQAPTACLGTVYAMLARLIGSIHPEAAVGNNVPGYSNTQSLCSISDGPASTAYVDCLLDSNGNGSWPASLVKYATFKPQIVSLGGTAVDINLGQQHPNETLSACLANTTPAGDACAEILVMSGRLLRVHGTVALAGGGTTDHWMLVTSVVKALPGDPSATAGTIIRLVANDPELGQQVYIDVNPNDGSAYNKAVLNPTGVGIMAAPNSYSALSKFKFPADTYRYITLH